MSLFKPLRNLCVSCEFTEHLFLENVVTVTQLKCYRDADLNFVIKTTVKIHHFGESTDEAVIDDNDRYDLQYDRDGVLTFSLTGAMAYFTYVVDSIYNNLIEGMNQEHITKFVVYKGDSVKMQNAKLQGVYDLNDEEVDFRAHWSRQGPIFVDYCKRNVDLIFEILSNEK